MSVSECVSPVLCSRVVLLLAAGPQSCGDQAGGVPGFRAPPRTVRPSQG